MRDILPGLQAHLDGGTTTLAKCWRIVLTDGAVLGFTEHDRDLVFDGVTHRAATGFVGSAIGAQLGLAVGDQEIAGVLSADGIDAAALEAGAYDGAEVSTFLVNWAAVSERALLARGEIGEVRRGSHGFEAELRSVAARLNVPVGRTYQPVCDAVLGDARCGVDLADPAYRGTGVVVASAEGRVLTVSGLSGFGDDWFTGGVIHWTGGANHELRAEVRRSGAGIVELWRAAPLAIAEGDTFFVTAGCDKRFAACCTKFANSARYRGFPHMPGNDWAAGYPISGDVHDGASLTA
ncbi:hypothetical protein sos41_31040 [Alphaproteobacteria bacterium SO-S41]|nr:hypothetical protein sos41_31040 [Alphaproteobacteria bacterium SO-S41]